jgi:hypothetical protein
MWCRYAFALLVFASPAISRAQVAPEQLLPDGAQIYLRWDGIEAHRPAYEKTAIGQMMKGDTGTFVDGAFGQLQESLGALLTVQQLLEGVPPKALKQLQDDAADAPKLLKELSRHGFLFTAEVRSLEPPQVQVTLVIPGAGEKPGPLFSALRLGTGLAKVEVAESNIAGRTVWHFTAGPVRAAWWIEGKHAMVSVGTDGPEAVLKRIQDKETARLSANPLFKKITGFKEFTTGLRGYLDVASLVKLAKTRDKKVSQLLDDLGLDGLKSLTFYSGFDGAAERSLTEWDMPGPRKGLLRLLGGKSFKLADVPPLAPDTLSWSMTNFDPSILYDEGLKAVEGVVGIVAPDELPKIKGFLDQADQALGVDLRKDLIGSLGGQFATYTSPAEGPLSFGQTYLFKVKDAKKLQETLDQVVKGIGKATGADISVKKKKYHGVELSMVEFRQQGFIFVPTYAIHKDWLIVGFFPQQVQGYILRDIGELPAWKPEPSTVAALDKLPKEFISISVSDPRPSVKQILSLAPLAGGAINSFVKESKFDVSSIPNSQEVTRHLFPNVGVVSDDGKTLRMETRASLALPFDVTGLDTYFLFSAAFLAFRGF